MAVSSVFISSVQRGFEDYREAARSGVERMQMYPVMAETAGARVDAPRVALLDEVERSDVHLLILGERYGQRGVSGSSPTEDEFNRAVELGKSILVLVRDPCEMEPEQLEFLARLRAGGWEDGALHGTFSSPADLTAAVMQALHGLNSAPAGDEGAAAERVAAFAQERDRRGSSSGVIVRCVFAPVEQVRLLDAVALDDEGLPDALAGLARSAGLAPHSVGLLPEVSSAGVEFTTSDSIDWATPTVAVYADGAIVAEGSARVEGPFAGSVIDPGKTEQLVQAAGTFAAGVWDCIDPSHRVRRIAVQIVVPDASMKTYGTVQGNKMSMAMGNPEVIVAPDEPLVVQRSEVTSDEFHAHLLAALKRAFADLDALAR